ncbi:MAG: TonB-dependent receptor [Pseudomonadota bacterium]
MKQLVTLAAMLAVLPIGAFAQSADDELVGEDIIVTGGLTPISVNQIGRAYTVITGEQLQARGTRYVADALRLVPGLAVSRTGSFGGLTQIRARGAEGNQILVLVDGIEISPAGNGEVDFGSLIVTDIERIEVLRGPQSALYGSNAAAGVIQIFTRRGRRNGSTFRGTLEGGSDGTALVSLNAAGGEEDWDGAIGVSLRSTQGFNIATGTDDQTGERDGDRNLTITGRANWDFTPDFSMGINFFVADRKSDTDDQAFPFDPVTFAPLLNDPTFSKVIDSNDVNDATDISIGWFGRFEMLDDALVHEVKLGFTHNTSNSLSDGTLSFGTESQRLKAGYQASYAFSTGDVDHVVAGLIDYEQEQNDTNFADQQSRRVLGLGGEYRLAFGPAALQASVRNDFNNQFKDALTFSFSGSYDLEATGTRLHGSVGRGVTNPTFFEQFGSSPGRFIGNRDLIPERTFQWDLGIEQSFFDDRFILDATYFRGTVTDEISSGFNAAAGLATSVNTDGESTREGVEISLTMTPLDELSITGSYTYTLAKDGASGLSEVRRPRHTAALDATYTFLGDRAMLNANLVYNGDQYDSDFATGFFPAALQPRAKLDGYFLLSLQGSYAVTEQLDVFARLENALNSDYQEVLNYETQGFTGFGGIKLTF